jgi:hypothetical protein
MDLLVVVQTKSLKRPRFIGYVASSKPSFGVHPNFSHGLASIPSGSTSQRYNGWIYFLGVIHRANHG